MFWETITLTFAELWRQSSQEPLFAPKVFALTVLILDLIRRRGRLNWPDQAIRSCIANVSMVIIIFKNNKLKHFEETKHVSNISDC